MNRHLPRTPARAAFAAHPTAARRSLTGSPAAVPCRVPLAGTTC
ncbi:hypothetical protein ACIRQY_35145 [Streptomyces sp. NPDC101490]